MELNFPRPSQQLRSYSCGIVLFSDPVQPNLSLQCTGPWKLKLFSHCEVLRYGKRSDHDAKERSCYRLRSFLRPAGRCPEQHS